MNDLVSDTPTAPASERLAPRQYGMINWIGLKTLYRREVGRFLKVAMQTVFAPVVSTLLFMTVFRLAFGGSRAFGAESVFAGIDFIDFLAPGLIMMAILNNAFQNSSSSLTISKVQGNSVDFLMPPLSSMELTLGFVLGAATRGILVAVLAAIAIQLSGLATLGLTNVFAILWFGFLSSLILGAFGAMGGIWSEKFDHLAAVTNFVIVPLTFLSGTFYDISVLVEPFETLSYFNPFFYLIDGFRYGFIGASNSNLIVGGAVAFGLAVAMIFCVYWMFRSGYKLKA